MSPGLLWGPLSSAMLGVPCARTGRVLCPMGRDSPERGQCGQVGKRDSGSLVWWLGGARVVARESLGVSMEPTPT